jgi:hypothetical protein
MREEDEEEVSLVKPSPPPKLHRKILFVGIIAANVFTLLLFFVFLGLYVHERKQTPILDCPLINIEEQLQNATKGLFTGNRQRLVSFFR